MAHQVPWNKIIVETFIEDAMLTDLEQEVLRTRVAGWTRTEQAMKLGVSVSTIDRVIATLKTKYDNVEKYNPLLPPRRTSQVEQFLDEN